MNSINYLFIINSINYSIISRNYTVYALHLYMIKGKVLLWNYSKKYDVFPRLRISREIVLLPSLPATRQVKRFANCRLPAFPFSRVPRKDIVQNCVKSFSANGPLLDCFVIPTQDWFLLLSARFVNSAFHGA